jgi:hypothetical protein
MSGRTFPRFALVGLLAAALSGSAVAQTSPAVAPMPRPARQHGEITIGIGVGVPQLIQSVEYQIKILDAATVAPMLREKNTTAVIYEPASATGPMVPLYYRRGYHDFLAVSAPPIPVEIPDLPRCNSSECSQPQRVIAPMPREKPALVCGEDIQFLPPSDGGLYRGDFVQQLQSRAAHEVAPMPRAAAADGLRVTIPQLGPLSLALDDTPLVQNASDKRQLFNFSVGVFGGDQDGGFQVPLNSDPIIGTPTPPGPPNPMVVLGTFRSDKNGNWWVQVASLPPPQEEGKPLITIACHVEPPCLSDLEPPCRPYAYPIITLGKFRCDKAGSWWVEVLRVPQPWKSPSLPCWSGECVWVHDEQPHTSTDASPVPAPGPIQPPYPPAFGGRTACGAGVRISNVMMDCPVCSEKAAKLAGTWVREVEGGTISVTVTGTEMQLKLSQCDASTRVDLTLTAEYTVTKEGLVYGVITGVDSQITEDLKPEDSHLLKEFSGGAFALVLQGLVDSPFSFRFKSTSVGMMVSNVKVASVGDNAKEIALYLGGMYKLSKPDAVPFPKPMKTQQGGLTLPSPRYLEHYPQYFPPDPSFPLPRELASQEDPVGAARGAPGGFGALDPASVAPMPRVKASGVSSPCCVDANCQSRTVAVAPPPREPGEIFGYFSTGPVGGEGTIILRRTGCTAQPTHWEHPMVALGNFRCDDNGGWWVEVIRIPQPRQAPPACNRSKVGSFVSGVPGYWIGAEVEASQPAGSCCTAAGKFTGTWYREVDGGVIAAVFTGNEMKLSFSQCDEKTRVDLIVTAEYTVTKEGLVYGVFTGVDPQVTEDPKQTDSRAQFTEFGGPEVAQIFQAMVDTPFSFRIKSTSVGMMVSNLKVASIGDSAMEVMLQFGGMYKQSKDGAIPAPKGMKTQRGGLTLPSPRYLEHYPQYFPPEPTTVAPLPRELPAYENAAESMRPVGVGTSPAVRPYTDWTPTPAAPQSAPMIPPPVPGSAVPGGGMRHLCEVTSPHNYPPLPPPPAPMGWRPTPPVNVPVGEFGMMAEVFGQMLGVQQTCPAQSALPQPVPCPVRPAGLYSAPSASCPQQRWLGIADVINLSQHGIDDQSIINQIRSTGSAFWLMPSDLDMLKVNGVSTSVIAAMQQSGVGVAPRVLACPVQVAQVQVAPVQMAKPGLVGTWVREVGPMLYVVTIAGDHITISMTSTVEVEDGKTATEGVILTADYHLTRDGTTMVGLITSVDAILEGELPPIEDPTSIIEDLEPLQKALTDKPLALSVRVYGDTLVIGNVRLPALDAEKDRGMVPLTSLGGRYKNNGEKPIPKPKPAKMPLPRAAAPPPTIASMLAPLVGASGTPALPGSTLPPAGVQVSPYGSGLPNETGLLPGVSAMPPTNPIPYPTPGSVLSEYAASPGYAPSPKMTPPTPPAVEQTESKNKKIETPQERMERLLEESEDLRRLQDAWRQLWSSDQPSRLTPERIHGGIQ